MHKIINLTNKKNFRIVVHFIPETGEAAFVGELRAKGEWRVFTKEIKIEINDSIERDSIDNVITKIHDMLEKNHKSYLFFDGVFDVLKTIEIKE